MTIIVKRDTNGETITVLGPVEEYDRLLQQACDEKRLAPVELLSMAARMDHDQLLHLVSILSGKVEHYARLVWSSFRPEHAKMVEQMRELRRMAKEAGEDLWPELGD